MSKLVKNIVIGINVVMLIFALFWTIDSKYEYEPIIVVSSQIVTLITLFFGDGIVGKASVRNVSKSKVNVDTPTGDQSNIRVNKIKDDSDIKIKRRN